MAIGNSTSLEAGGYRNLAETPSFDRDYPDGPLATLVESILERAKAEGFPLTYIVSDATPGENAENNRNIAFANFEIPSNVQLYFILPENQAKVAEKIKQKTGFPDHVIQACLQGTGYGDHRHTLNTISGAMMLVDGRPVRAVTFDDDMEFPSHRIQWKRSALPESIEQDKNSFVLFPYDSDHKILPNEMFDFHEGNTIHQLFTTQGRTIAELREQYPNIRVTHGVTDTRGKTLEDAFNGDPVQYVLTYDDGADIANAEYAVVVGTELSKAKRSDYHTYYLAKMAIVSGLPSNEVPMEAYRSGSAEVFAAQGSDTIFPDGATFGFYLDEETVHDPRFFTPSVQASKSNPLGLITGMARADNDMLPILLPKFSKARNKQYVYLSVDTDALHSRALGANRQKTYLGAISAMVGYLAELESYNNLQYDQQTGLWHVDRQLFTTNEGTVDPNYRVPDTDARRVFNRIAALGVMATVMGRKYESTSYYNSRKVAAFTEIRDSIQRMLAGVNLNMLCDNLQISESDLMHVDEYKYTDLLSDNFTVFHKHLSQEIAEHVIHYSEIVDATPTIMLEVAELIKEGNYPVVQYTNGSVPFTSHPLQVPRARIVTDGDNVPAQPRQEDTNTSDDASVT